MKAVGPNGASKEVFLGGCLTKNTYLTAVLEIIIAAQTRYIYKDTQAD